MTPERYKRIGQLFEEALELAPEQRAAWLDQVCPLDSELRTEVETLLANQKEADNFLSRPAMDIAPALLAQTQHASLLGQRVSHYQVFSLLGAGGMGEVYLAEDTKLERRVALKILPPEFAEDKERMSRFVREAKSASALNHPNIITIYEIGEIDSTHFIAAEYITGETLHTRLKQHPLDVNATLDIAIQVASALDAAHRAGIVHRDIKPDNIMIRPDGLVKILDFGIAKLSEKKAEPIDKEAATAIKPPSTNPGVIIGTANYMSPEQARGKTVDARSDVFSFGIVLYEMLSGKRAFAGETVSDVIVAVLTKEPKRLSEIPAEL